MLDLYILTIYQKIRWKKGEDVSYGDDCSYVYGIRICEQELKNSIKLDDENSAWRLFTREELNNQFKVHNPKIHGENFNEKEMHVALAKSLLVLDAAKNNFENVEEAKINYPYTNSPGFFARYKNLQPEVKEQELENIKDQELENTRSNKYV